VSSARGRPADEDSEACYQCPVRVLFHFRNPLTGKTSAAIRILRKEAIYDEACQPFAQWQSVRCFISIDASH